MWLVGKCGGGIILQMEKKVTQQRGHFLGLYRRVYTTGTRGKCLKGYSICDCINAAANRKLDHDAHARSRVHAARIGKQERRHGYGKIGNEMVSDLHLRS